MGAAMAERGNPFLLKPICNGRSIKCPDYGSPVMVSIALWFAAIASLRKSRIPLPLRRAKFKCEVGVERSAILIKSEGLKGKLIGANIAPLFARIQNC